MYKINHITLLLLVLVSTFGILHSQNLHERNLKTLDKFLKDEDYKTARTFTLKHIDSLIAVDSFYEAVDYTYYLGQIEINLNNKNTAIKVVSDLESRIQNKTNNKKTLRQLALEVGSFYESIGDSETAKNYNHKALDITKSMPEATGKDFALIESNLGVFYSRLGDLTNAIKFHKKGLSSLKSDSTSTADSYYISYNSLGAMMWYTSKFDSAIYYYKKADKTLKSLEQNPWNRYYRTASLNNNIAGIYSIKGDLDASIQAMRMTVNNLNAFLKEDISDSKRSHAQKFLFQAIENYAGLYKDIGDYKKAKQLLDYSYQLKKKHHPIGSPEIAKAKVLMGQIELTLKNRKKAENLLDQGIEDFKNNNGDYKFWLAEAYYGKALIYMNRNENALAKTYFEKSEAHFKTSLGDYYDQQYIDFTINASNFYSETGQKDKALSMANEALDYIRNNQGEKTLLEYNQVLNLANIYYENQDYNNALTYSERALDLLNSDAFLKNNNLNTLKIESNKVSAILIQVKTNLELTKDKDETFLIAQLKKIDEAIELLENKKSIISEDSSASILIQDNIEIFEIAKELNLKLFELTKKEDYLESLLSYHESMIYHKIRNRLNSKSSQLTANLPKDVLEEEQALKKEFNNPPEETVDLNVFFENEKKWADFLNRLKVKYPKYYNLKYASITQSLEDLKNKVPKSSTIVRYLFIQDNLYAFIIDSSSINMLDLNGNEAKGLIAKFNEQTEVLQPTFSLQSELYNVLWQPFSKKIQTKNIIIIPDKEIFNLSFELLTTKTCQYFKDLKTHSLLAKHTFSYNYSLFLIDKNSQPIGYDSNFIGFAPEFSEAMKTNYKVAIKDSVELDYSYLTLLPQPFAKNLAESYSQLFNGNSFLNENASKSIFTKNAKEHKIIHIGTHAESNNISPELSRLIFAKNISNDSIFDDNYLYTYEIYNQDLSSNLAILTACETGKPTFQPGEGMISLAHAFNYAGSESILTSLWKIDEQSSAIIIENFYEHLKNGKSKDDALKQAKLDYLEQAEGRMKSPQYWAGLILIGDTSAIEFKSNSQWWVWMLSVAVAILLLVFFFRHKPSKT